MVITGIFLNSCVFNVAMEHKIMAIVAHGVLIMGVLLLFFAPTFDFRLMAGLLVIADLAALLIILVSERPWDATHLLSLSLVVLGAAFVILFLGTRITGVSYLFGGFLIIQALFLTVVEIVEDWRSYRMFDKFIGHPHEHRELVVETLHAKKKAAYRLLAPEGGKLYHRDSCRVLAKKPGKTIELHSVEEATSFGLKPCGFCKP